jgi:hypothetical protein
MPDCPDAGAEAITDIAKFGRLKLSDLLISTASRLRLVVVGIAGGVN